MDTPTAPLPDPDEGSKGKTPKRKRRRKTSEDGAAVGGILLPSFKAGLTYMLSAWRVLIIILGVHLLIAATVVLPMQDRLSARLDAHAHAPALAGDPDAYDARLEMWQEGGLEASIWNDAKRLEKTMLDANRITLYWIVLIAWLFGAVVNGGHLATFVEGERPTVSGFFVHGARWFWRMLRVGIVFGLVYYVVARLVLELWAGVVGEDERMSSSAEAIFYGEAVRTIIMVLVFLWLRVACDLGRADLVVYGRSSALGAVLRGFGRTFRHPIRTFGLAILCGLPMIVLVFGISFLVDVFDQGSFLHLAAGFVLIELAVLLRLASRAALLAGDASLLMSSVRTR